MNRSGWFGVSRAAGLWIGCLLCMIAFSGVAAVVEAKEEITFDRMVSSWVQSFENSGLTAVAKAVTFLGSVNAMVVMCAVVLLYLFIIVPHKREALLFAAVMLGTPVWNVLLKLSFQRERPDFNRLIEITGYSFPSGHSMAAFSLCGIAAYLLWRRIASAPGRMLLLTGSGMVIAGIGLSRIYLGVHYPSDVIGGFLASGAWLLFVTGFYEQRRGTFASRAGTKGK